MKKERERERERERELVGEIRRGTLAPCVTSVKKNSIGLQGKKKFREKIF